MLRLLRVELRRLLARRVVRIVGLLLLLGIVLGNGYRFTKHSSDLEAARERARVTAENERERIRRDYPRIKQEYEQGFRGPSIVVPPGSAPGAPSLVEGMPGQAPSLEEMLAEVRDEYFYSDPRYFFSNAVYEVKAVGIFVAVLAFAIGTTFAGAEWSAGTMQALLFWEPRRGRVVAAKLAALGAVVVAASWLGQLLQLGFAYATAVLRGEIQPLPPDYYENMLEGGFRIGLLAAFTSLLAFSIAGLVRNTGGALAVAFVYFAVVENVVRSVRPLWGRWLISNQFAAWVDKQVEIYGPYVQRGDVFEQVQPFILRMNRAGLTLLVYLAVVAGAFTFSFMRRDVT